MARKARLKSEIGIYHVLLRGVNVLFAQEADYEEFTSLLAKHKKLGSIKIFAYSLLPNRIHLVLETEEDVGKALKPICTSYARYFNRTYSRGGKLFYDRMKSEPIDSETSAKSAIAFVNNIGKNDRYSSPSQDGRLIDTDRFTQEELTESTVTEMFCEDYDRLSREEIDAYILALSGTHPKDFKKLSQEEKETAIARITEKRWIARTRLEKLLDVKKARQKPEVIPEQTKKEALSFWLL